MSYSDFEIKDTILIKYHGRGSCAVTPQKLISVRIPETVKIIGDSAFSCCQGIESAELPEGITEIGQKAFYNCKNLKYINLPESVRKIESYAFQGCKNLIQVKLPAQLETYGEEVFSRGVNLENYPDGFIILNHTLYQYIGTDTTVRIPEGVTYVKRRSISSWEINYSVEHVIFPESIQKIEYYAMNQDENTKSLTFHQIQVFLNEEEMKWIDAMALIACIKRFFMNLNVRKHQRNLRKYLKKMLFYLEDKTFQKIIDTGKIYSEKEIETYLKMAIKHQLYTKQMILMHYKYQNLDFDTITDRLKL